MTRARFYGLRGKSLNRFIIWAVICPAYILFGWNNALAGGLLDLELWIETFPRINTLTTTGEQNADNSRVQGTVVSIYTLGCFFGSLSCIWIGDRLGRIRTIMLGALLNVIGSILQASSFSLGQLIVGRIVSGLGFGALTATAPNWQSECSKAEHRGSLVILESVFISFGLGLWSLIVLAVIYPLPESPRWLVKNERIDEAKEVLSALHDESDTEEINKAIQEIQDSLSATGHGKFRDIFTNGKQRLFHRTCLAAACQSFQQLCGINTIAFYVSTIFQQDLGLSATDSQILGAAVFTWQTVASPIGVLTVERAGRRKLMLISCVGMGISMAVLAGTVSQPNNHAAIVVAGVFIFVFSGFFPVGFLGMTFLYAAEIAPISVRVPITSISTGTAWLLNFMVAEVTPVAFSTIGYKYYIVWAVLNFFLIFPCVYLFFPETAGRSLEEVDEIFEGTTGIFNAVSVASKLPRKHEAREEVVVAESGGKTQADQDNVVEAEPKSED